MDSPTQEDSLVFANEPPRPLRPSSPYEPTQIDHSTSPMFGNDSLSFANRTDLNASPLAAHSLSRMFSDDDTAPDRLDALGSDGISSHVPISSPKRPVSTLRDTQVVSGSPRGSDPMPDSGVPHSLNYHDLGARFGDTQVVGSSRKPSEVAKSRSSHLEAPDTQLIGGATAFSGDTQVVNTYQPDHHAVGAAETQLIGAPPPFRHSQDMTQHVLQDTQAIGSALNPSDTQVDEALGHASGAKAPTQALPEPPKAPLHTPTKGLQNADTQVIGIHPSGPPSSFPEITQTDQIPGTSSESAPLEPAFHDSLDPSPFVQRITFDVDSSQKIEPTTQVANTQEELIESNYQAMDIGCKSIFSSSQNDGQKRIRSDLSVVSNDESFVDLDDAVSNVYDDSLFRHKRRRVQKATSESPELGPMTGANDSSTSSFGIKMEEPVHCSPSPSPHRRPDWSQSSSELEDFSHDASNLDWEKIAGGSSVDSLKFSDPSEPLLQEESSPALSSECIKNPSGVWAFFQFKLFPAKLIQPGETTSLVEYSDLKQVQTKNTDLYLLDIRVGDVVDVISKSGAYVVTALELQDAASTFRCFRGFDTVILAKVRPGTKKQPEIRVPLYSICMEADQWATHQARFHVYYKNPDAILQNYSVAQKVLDLNTEDVQGVHPQPLSFQKSVQTSLFKGMLFFATALNEERKVKLEEVITSNGGTFFDGEIMHFLSSKPPKQQLARYFFAALLSDSHSRSPKYLQALALGWPILADTFIESTLDDHSLIKCWSLFLLPAGFSTHANASTNQNIFSFMSKSQALDRMSHQLSNNSGLLRNFSILVMNKGQDEKVLETCKFIFQSFGAKSLGLHETCEQIEYHIKEIQKKSGQLIVYDNSAKDFSRSYKKASRKQRNSRSLAVVDWEWVVQCVISGHIWTPETFIEI